MSRRRRAHLHQEHVNHERWLVSYADFVTLLFALFVVLFASSHHDKKTIETVSNAVRNGFKDMGSFSSSNGTPALSPSDMATTAKVSVAKNGAAGIDTVELQRKLHQALGKEIARQEIQMRSTPEGFVISLHELGFFSSGQATLQPGAGEKIKRIAEVLVQYGLDMRVEGHSDNVPIHNSTFASNWELSTARAMAVAMMLMKESQVDPQLLSVAGYGEYHPAASNDTDEGRRANRRVDIVVVSSNKPIPAQPPV